MPTATAPAFELDTDAAIQRLLRFLSVNAITGHETAIGKELVAALKEVGVPEDAIAFDDAHTRIPEPTPIGNLIVKLPGVGKKNAAPEEPARGRGPLSDEPHTIWGCSPSSRGTVRRSRRQG